MSSTRRAIGNALYVLPAIALIGLFVYYPLGANIVFSFFSFRAGSGAMDPVGLGNVTRLFTDPVIATALRNNLVYAVVSVVCQVGGALVVAAWLTHLLGRRMGAFLRSVYFLPAVISMTVIALLFTFVFNARGGLLNELLQDVGLGALQTAWLANPHTALGSVIAVSQWQSIGYVCMLYVVALQQIPQEYYEAASLDGAGRIRQFFSITVPQAKEMIFVAMILTVSGAFTVFNEPYILTKGGPGNASQVLATYMYNQGFFQNQMGYASAIASLIFLITLVLSVVQMLSFRSGRS
ncbi:carbohydrate ABC transporter permease [Microbacterium dextranolyticum]|uniref:ABC transporter permease protein YurN n=1 Tax=Microbacterium dextranolyticum TaxID=36806 RepID=A0A9W6HKU0_9MICO|nr:sugar ABC transporter permease [Microbacterium dextranolyticum]MBM7464125.1 raffinose/stachyose/melibiose transport system permease protein [Microbacterium dextranolyticum]GLJ95120.1 putative ABC transporter permease protein YurN [Microbacterium dextranolyticum]